MKIKRKDGDCTIFDLRSGECFEYQDDLFMVTDECDKDYNYRVLCVNLEEGIILRLDGSKKVKKVNVKAVEE